jgi:hypothetical protein
MENNLELIPKDIIRSETALSRFPIHRLSKKGEISIDIKIKNDRGELKTKWEVTHNSKYGQPSPLAYKVDTLIINRKIEEAGKPVPKTIRLGSLTEIAQQTGTGDKNTNAIKKALLQNAFTAITAKFTYKTITGEEKTIEIADTRYGVVFTGEKLPNGDKADATYILLHDLYREILNSAPTRPLDYEYLRELTPTAQRFYELLSYQIYGALKSRRLAKMLYSEFCTYAPQARYFTWEQVKKQMYKLHKPHLKSGYVESISYEQIRGEDGSLDWLFSYTPGRKAKGEHTFATTRKTLPRAKEIKSNPVQPSLIPDEPRPALIPDVELSFSETDEKLISKMREFGVGESKARSLVKSHREAVEREIEYFPYRDLANAKNAAGLFIKAVTESYEPPPSYFEEFKAADTKKKNDERAKEAEQKRKIQAEESRARERATERLNGLTEKDRSEIWEMKRTTIFNAPENQEPSKRKTLELVIDGMIRAEIISEFMSEERQNSAE